jgi:hypothetical protein
MRELQKQIEPKRIADALLQEAFNLKQSLAGGSMVSRQNIELLEGAASIILALQQQIKEREEKIDELLDKWNAEIDKRNVLVDRLAALPKEGECT